MPLYEYVADSGERLEVLRPVAERNLPLTIGGATFRREALEKVHLSFPGLPPDRQLAERTLKNYYNLEQQKGSSFRSSYTKQQIKEAWSPRHEDFIRPHCVSRHK